MATTIQVSETTRQLLEKVKLEESASSYDQVILHLVREHSKVAKSLFGAAKGLSWNKTDRLKLHEL